MQDLTLHLSPNTKFLTASTREGQTLLGTLPRVTRRIAADATAFAEYLRDCGIGKRIQNIDSLMPRLQAIATSY